MTDAQKPLPDKITEKAIKELRQERYWQGQPIWEFQAAMQIQDVREKAIAQRLRHMTNTRYDERAIRLQIIELIKELEKVN